MNSPENFAEKMARHRAEKGVERLTPTEKARRNPKSLRLAITAFCWECVGQVRQDVTGCTATKCPLYPMRPWQK